ncbi:CDC45-like protein [Dacryopinax primogenitus]|uniref:CDC45-like protein n=1 Tax=Dacryopinax primogenitus (strain DJM 731) TaxID=1858805 RepID=M5GE98_DACPD|nr:CDC45-like protein [Dacryopinax primogenitus]EJU05197.1 CDC45-like protein [Dacryopinax primogenitus]
MVYLSPPTSSHDATRTYLTAYREILANRRTRANTPSAVVLLAALEVDSLCACRMLASLLTRDGVQHRIEPVAGYPALVALKEQLSKSQELHTLVLLNIGSMLDLASEDWFGEFGQGVRIHVIDSRRPRSLPNLFGVGESQECIVVWDDGEVAKLAEERKAFEETMFDESDSDSEDDDDEEEEEDDDDDEEDGEGTPRKKRKLNGGAAKRERREKRDEYLARLDKYYTAGTSHGQSCAGTIYVLATALERADNALLWLAILGLTHQYLSARIKRSTYEQMYEVFSDEVARLNVSVPGTINDAGTKQQLTADDTGIRPSEEMRFMLVRHWNLYDAMYHSAYVMSRLRAWNEKGRKQLGGMLAKMGFSLQQCQQAFIHMDQDLKRSLRAKMDNYAPEYGLIELTYASFTRSFGFRLQPLSAADVVEGVGALLEAAEGVKLEVELEGGRGGGEWFGGSKAWQLPTRSEGKENRPLAPPPAKEGEKSTQQAEEEQREQKEEEWWVGNFWAAYDALGMNINLLRNSLPLAMALQRAIVRQGTALISKRAITQTKSFRLATIREGPDLALFAHPSTLSRLALWLVDATRNWVQSMQVGRKKRLLPFVIACAKEEAGTFVVVGVTGAGEMGDVRPNTFNLAFLEARDRSGARTRQVTFDTSVVEVNKEDLHKFLETLAMRAA